MANDQSRTQTLFPLETCPQVSDEDFNRFHSIDRELYTRLVQNLGRVPAESVQLMAFWLWLERESNESKLIKRLLSLPLLLLSEIADETRVCLMCLESDKLQFGGELTLLPEIVNIPAISLRFFHENRTAVLRSVAKIINTVCTRAFRDIPARAGNPAPPVVPMMYNPHLDAPPFVPLHPGLIKMPLSPVGARLPINMGGFPAFDLAAQRHMAMNTDLGEIISRNMMEEIAVHRNLPMDDRTVFLTFSKGYPTAEDEVKDFFTRKFGDFIEELIFQEVGDEEQVLYARMVVKPAMVGVIEEIVGRGNKAKYTINGKHVWARKYVKKSRSPPRGGRGAASSSFQSVTP